MLQNLLPTQGSNSELINDALERYFILQSEKDIGESIGSKILGLHDQDNELKDLDIKLKRRQLSMMGPDDSQDFNDTPAPKILSALGITWARDLEPPAFPKVGNGMAGLSKYRDLFTDAKELGHVAGSIGRRRSGPLGRIAAALF